MQSLSEKMHEAESRETQQSFIERMKCMTTDERHELIRYFKMVGAKQLAQELFSLESLDIVSGVKELHIPEEKHIYTPYSRENGEFFMDSLTEHELDFLLQAFFKNTQDRAYVIKMVFLHDNFLHKTQGDTLDYLSKLESLFLKVSKSRKIVLHIVSENDTNLCDEKCAANDTHIIPLVDRIEDMENGYFNYVHETYKARLEYVESLFCHTVISLSEESHNHIWAIDPENTRLHIPPHIQGKIELIRSICECHQIFDSHFPQLHTLIEPTVASWILIYKGFSAPIERVRKIIGGMR